MACVEVTLTGDFNNPCTPGLFLPGASLATPQVSRWSFRGVLITSGGTVLANWSRSILGVTTTFSSGAGFSVTPVSAPETAIDTLLTGGGCLLGFPSLATPTARVLIRTWNVCIPDALCAAPLNLIFFADGTTEGTAPVPGGNNFYSQRVSYVGATFTQTSTICTGGGGGSPTGCYNTSCGECCESDRLLRVARCWGMDGNVYSVNQGTFARNAPGPGSSYPCGCGSASEPLPAGDFFATDIHDRDNPSKLAGSQAVSLYPLEGLIQGTSLETSGTSKVVRLFRTRDFGREFTVMDVPGSYDFIQSVPHMGRLLLFGFRKKAATAPAGTKQLFLRVGKQLGDGTYSWSGEVAINLPAGAPEPKCGDYTLAVRFDQQVELMFLSGTPPCGVRLYRSHRIDLDGTNEWE